MYSSSPPTSPHHHPNTCIVTDRRKHSYFNQANKNVEVVGPLGKYPRMTAHQYIMDAVARNFRQLENGEVEKGELLESPESEAERVANGVRGRESKDT